MTKRKELQLDKAPITIDTDKETPAQRLVKLQGFLKTELAAHGNSLYAQDLQLTMNQIQGI